MSFHDASTNYQNFLDGQTEKTTGEVHFDNDHIDVVHAHPHVGQIQKEAVLGDVLEFHRGSNPHYALYLGNGKVMSIDVEDDQPNDCARIHQRNLNEVCDHGEVRVCNNGEIAKSLFKLHARKPQDILQSAKSFEERVVPYECDFRNSEYYCTLWRYGKGFSRQAGEKIPNAEDSKSHHWKSNNTGTDYFLQDGYAKYKQLAENRQEGFENNMH